MALKPDATLAREEVFGPVLGVMRFGDRDEAIRVANDTVYGLAAGLWTSDINLAHRAAREIKAGPRVDQRLGLLRHHHAVRRLQAVRFRTRPLAARAAQIRGPQVGLDHTTLKVNAMNIITPRYPNAALIGGQWVTGTNVFPVLDPATGQEIARVPNLGAKETRDAIDAAQAAFPAWSAKTAKERAGILRRWFDLIIADTEPLAQLMTSEQGKPLAEARGEVAYGASFVEWFAEEGKRAYGRTIPTTASSKRFITIKQPIGVVAAIAPWNFPIAMITRKVAPALAAGCTVVIKPSEETPLCALALAKLALDAGVPPGVLNVVTTLDAPAVGKVLCEDSAACASCRSQARRRSASSSIASAPTR